MSLRELQPDILTLPEHLIANGYEAAYCGKTFHEGDTDEGRSWSREPVKRLPGVGKPKGYARPENIKMQQVVRSMMNSHARSNLEEGRAESISESGAS